jgi:hypothetical protein
MDQYYHKRQYKEVEQKLTKKTKKNKKSLQIKKGKPKLTKN